ncbi:MAG TPA: YqiA/YcfP family alpha/beta fold hydrolase [Planktothrix sp.]|jgi:hypothetical protein
MSRKFNQCAVLFLHGFAAGPTATKCEFMRERLESEGCLVDVPDLNGDSFEHMTITSQLQIIDRSLAQIDAAKHLILMGSGMGAVLATIKSQQLDRLRGLVLLSPGFGIVRRWTKLLGPEMLNDWRTTRTMDVHHYQVEQELPLSYDFFEDAQRYQTDDLKVECPTLVLHGRHDDVIPSEESKRFAKQNPKSAELHVMDDSDMVRWLDEAWEKTDSFIQRVIAVPAR